MGKKSNKPDAVEMIIWMAITYLFTLLFKKWRERKYRSHFIGFSVNEHIQKIDLMDGRDFEIFVEKLYSLQGYKTKLTPTTGDQGIDVIAAKNGQKYGIQVKRYDGAVGNAAVQEVIAGKIYHNCDYGIVITNSTFTKSAIQLAESEGSIELIDRAKLKKLIYESHLSFAKQSSLERIHS